jgi:putative transposase
VAKEVRQFRRDSCVCRAFCRCPSGVYPFHDHTILVTRCGRICFKGRKVNLSHVFAGQSVGVTQVGERIWLVTFMQYDLGYFDDETCPARIDR